MIHMGEEIRNTVLGFSSQRRLAKTLYTDAAEAAFYAVSTYNILTPSRDEVLERAAAVARSGNNTLNAGCRRIVINS
jgi:hypothetical protein